MFLPFLAVICMGGTLRMSNFKILSIFMISEPQYSYQKCHLIWSTTKFAEQNSRFNLSWSEFVWEVYPKDFKFQNSEYRGHQVGPKYTKSQNFSFLASPVGEAKIYANDNGNFAWQTEKNYRSNHVFYIISNKKIFFFSSLN
jgi:hypothetical protein